jgi:hypothetical protein
MIKMPAVNICKLPMLNCLHYAKIYACLAINRPAGFIIGPTISKGIEKQILQVTGYTSLRGWNE